MLLATRSPRLGAEPAPLDETARARKLFEEGARRFDAGAWDLAIEAFLEGYAISKAPGFLYNAARAYEAKRDCGAALQHYRAYERLDPEGARKYAVGAHLPEVERCAAAQARPPVEPAPARTPVLPAAVAAPRPPAAGRVPRLEAAPDHGLGTWAIVAGAAGVGLLGLSGYFSVYSARAGADAQTLVKRGGTWSQELSQREDRAKAFDGIAPFSYSLGGLALLGSGLLYWLDARSRGPAEARVGIAPVDGGVRLTWQRRF